jgi:hypothetical protein
LSKNDKSSLSINARSDSVVSSIVSSS